MNYSLVNYVSYTCCDLYNIPRYLDVHRLLTIGPDCTESVASPIGNEENDPQRHNLNEKEAPLNQASHQKARDREEKEQLNTGVETSSGIDTHLLRLSLPPQIVRSNAVFMGYFLAANGFSGST